MNMKPLKRLFTDHWEAKLLSLVLAFVLWAVVRKSLEATGSPPRTGRPAVHFELSRER